MHRLGSAILVGVLLLSGCSRPGELPSQEVLRRATAQSRQLQSVSFDARVEMTAGGATSSSLKAQLKGRLAHGGEQTAWTVTGDGSWGARGSKTDMHVEADVMTEFADTYVQVRALRLSPQQAGFAGINGLLGTWWKLPGSSTGSPATVTPDPKFLRAQSDVVTVTKDHGISSVHGRDAYQYDVAIDPEKMIAFLKQAAEESGKTFDAVHTQADLARYDITGELWIDSETFNVHRVAWIVMTKKEEKRSPLRLDIQIDLADHDAALPITPPETSKPLEKSGILEQLFLHVMQPSLPTP